MKYTKNPNTISMVVVQSEIIVSFSFKTFMQGNSSKLFSIIWYLTHLFLLNYSSRSLSYVASSVPPVRIQLANNVCWGLFSPHWTIQCHILACMLFGFAGCYFAGPAHIIPHFSSFSLLFVSPSTPHSMVHLITVLHCIQVRLGMRSYGLVVSFIHVLKDYKLFRFSHVSNTLSQYQMKTHNLYPPFSVVIYCNLN